MNKKVQKLAFVLLLFFIAGTIAVFALSREEYNDYALRGWRSGYNYASQNPDAKVAPKDNTAPVNTAYRNAGVSISSSADREKRGAIYEGFVAGFWAQRNGN